jgi:hypothetical protein
MLRLSQLKKTMQALAIQSPGACRLRASLRIFCSSSTSVACGRVAVSAGSFSFAVPRFGHASMYTAFEKRSNVHASKSQLLPIWEAGRFHLLLLGLFRRNLGCPILSLALLGCSCRRYTSTRRPQLRTRSQTLQLALQSTKSLSYSFRLPVSLVFLSSRLLQKPQHKLRDGIFLVEDVT